MTAVDLSSPPQQQPAVPSAPGGDIGSALAALKDIPDPSGQPAVKPPPALDGVVGSVPAQVFGLDHAGLGSYQRVRAQYPQLFGPLDQYTATSPSEARQPAEPPPIPSPQQPGLTPPDLLNDKTGSVLRARSVTAVADAAKLTKPVQVGFLNYLADQYSQLPNHAASTPVTALGWEMNKWQVAADRGVLPKEDLAAWQKFRKGDATAQDLTVLAGRMQQFAQSTAFIADPHLAVHPVLSLTKMVPQQSGDWLVFKHRNFADTVDLAANQADLQARLGKIDYRALAPIATDNLKTLLSHASEEERQAAAVNTKPELSGPTMLAQKFAGSASGAPETNADLSVEHPSSWEPVKIDGRAHNMAIGMSAGGTVPPGAAHLADVYRALALDEGMTPDGLRTLASNVWDRLRSQYASEGHTKPFSIDDRVLQLVSGDGDLAPHQLAAGIPPGDMMVPAHTLGQRSAPGRTPSTLTVASSPTGDRLIVAPPTANNLQSLGVAYPTPYRDGRPFDDGRSQAWSTLWGRRFAAPVDDVHAQHDRIQPADRVEPGQPAPATELHAQSADTLPSMQGRKAIVVNALTDLSKGHDPGVQGAGLAIHNSLLRELAAQGVKPADTQFLNPHQADTSAGSASRQALVLSYDKASDLKRAWDIVSGFAGRYNEPNIDRRAYVFGSNETPTGTVPVLEHHYQGPDGSTLVHLDRAGDPTDPHVVQTWVHQGLADQIASPVQRMTIDYGADGQTAVFNGAVRVVEPGAGAPLRLKPSGLLDATRNGERVSRMSVWVPPTSDVPVVSFSDPAVLARRNPAVTPDRVLTGKVEQGRLLLKVVTTPGGSGEDVFNLSMFERARQALVRAGVNEVVPNA